MTENEPRRLLVIALAGIGDTLLATPMLRVLREGYPDAVIDALVLWPGAQQILQHNPHINTVHQRHLLQESRTGSIRFLWGLRRHRYDVSINTHPQSRIHYRVAAWLAGAKWRLSHQYECFHAVDRMLVNRVIPQDYGQHTVLQNLKFLPLLGGPAVKGGDLEIFLTVEEKQWSADWVRQHQLQNRLTLGVHMGSGGTKNLKLKRWPLEQYIHLFRRLGQTHPEMEILLFGGPEETGDHQRVLGEVGTDRVRAVRTSTLRQTAALMSHCHSFLSVDTALMHIAAAMKVPRQIVIEAPTLNATNLPYGNPFRLVKNPTVAGRNLDYYRYDGRQIRGSTDELIRCMASVTVDSVHRALQETLA